MTNVKWSSKFWKNMYAVDAYTNPHEIKELEVGGQPKKRVIYHPE